MKKEIGLVLVFFSLSATAQEYRFDPTHTNARFNIDHFNTSTNHGGFYNIEGELHFDPQHEIGTLSVTIPVKTLNTGVDAFNQHMLSADLLDVKNYPSITFTSTQWHFKAGEPDKIEGALTIRDQTHPVTLTVEKFGCYDNPIFQREVCGGDFVTTIDRTQWGVDFLVDQGMSKEVTILVQAEAIKQ